MLNTRSFSTSSLSQRAGARRRVRRSSGTANQSLYCRTNGCTTYMELDATGRATCPICGARRAPR